MSTTMRPLPVVRQPAAQPAVSEEWLRAARRARLLSWISLAWMGTEGLVGIATGVVAGSIALTGFGINAFIEGFASVVIVWRFTGSRMHSQKAEARAHRIVAIQFFILAPYVAYEAIGKLVHADHPGTSWLGIALVTTSAIGMPLLGRAKQRLAHTLGSGATHGEGDTERALRLPLAGGAGGAAREHASRLVVARPDRRARDCRPRDPRGTSELARRELLRILLATRKLTMGDRDVAWVSPWSFRLSSPC
jgi:hypothetical protein